MLKDKLMEDLKQSMKEKNEVRKNTIQMVRAAILQIKEVKGEKDALVDFEKAKREDLINQTNEEISILQEYLPKQLSKEEIKVEVEKVIKDVGATSLKDMGMVMKESKARIGAGADGKTINEVVKELLG